MNVDVLTRWVRLERITLEVVAYGWLRGVLNAQDVVAIALARLVAGIPLDSREETIALLLSDELDRVSELMPEVLADGGETEPVRRLWAYACLAELRSGWSRTPDVLLRVGRVVEYFEVWDSYGEVLSHRQIPWWTRALGAEGLLCRLDELLDEDAARCAPARTVTPELLGECMAAWDGSVGSIITVSVDSDAVVVVGDPQLASAARIEARFEKDRCRLQVGDIFAEEIDLQSPASVGRLLDTVQGVTVAGCRVLREWRRQYFESGQPWAPGRVTQAWEPWVTSGARGPNVPYRLVPQPGRRSVVGGRRW